ncbi:MAG: chemotaxis protein CheD [Acidobacteriota bacterium]
MRDATMLQMSKPSEQRVVVGIGEYGVSKHPGGVIVTHALGSCVAVCLWDPVAGVAGLLHILLPDSRINLERAAQQPGAFADTGIPILFHAAYQQGAVKARCQVQLIGGAEVTITGGQAIGKRNVLAARAMLWRNGVKVEREVTGGSQARSVWLSAGNGEVQVTTAGIRVA